MCSHYQAEKRRRQIEKRFGITLPPNWEPPRGSIHLDIHPTYMAPIIRRPLERSSGDDAVPDFEVVGGHFGMLARFAKDLAYSTTYRTYNARTETVAELRTFKESWERARHCIVPCEAIYEPDWRNGEHVPTRFTAANDDTLGVAGIWAPWRNPATRQEELTFAMLTVNADDHPMFSLMHKPDRTRPPDQQDKRMVVILPSGLYEEWLDAPVERSMDFVKQYPAEKLRMVGEPIPKAQMRLF
ncbi:SOS response associated peptidase (SRAP) [compost metagenome]